MEAKRVEAMAAIDWHDFVVAETIDFTKEDEQIALQPPRDFSKAFAQDTLDPEMQPEVIVEEEDMDMEEIEEEEEEEIVAPGEEEEVGGGLSSRGKGAGGRLEKNLGRRTGGPEVVFRETENFLWIKYADNCGQILLEESSQKFS